jgi:hypothetical protein
MKKILRSLYRYIVRHLNSQRHHESLGKHKERVARSGTTTGTTEQRRSYQSEAIAFNTQFLKDHYELRYNTMKGVTEFRPLRHADDTGTESWQTLGDRELNSIVIEQLMLGGRSWTYGMRLCIESSRVTEYNPVTAFLDSCPQWDGQDHIGRLAGRVPNDYEHWEPFFHRWVLAMVAQWCGQSQRGNSLVPMLVGGQGTHKTTFCSMLLPAQLRDYFMDDIKMNNAEQAERVMGRMALVNIDEYNAKTAGEQARIKRLLTEHNVQVRRMRSEQYTSTRRMASFIATTNEAQPLTDETGSRRYLCVRLTGNIDTEGTIDHTQLYAQALHELRNGAPCYLSPSEEAMLEEHNKAFRTISTAEELLTTCYEPAPRSREHLLTATEILEEIISTAKHVSDRPSMRQLVHALKAQQFVRGAWQGRHGWYAQKRCH